MKFLDRIKTQVIIVLILEAFALALLFMLGRTDILLPVSIFVAVDAILVAWIVFTVEQGKAEQDIEITRVLGSEAKEAFTFGKVGMLTYDDNNVVTWMDDFLLRRDSDMMGRKVTTFFEDIALLFQGEVDVVSGQHGDYIYEVTRKEEGHMMFVKDITRLATITRKYDEESTVFGMVHLDNYMDISSYEDETRIANINAQLRQPIVDWATSHGIMIRRMRSDRFMLVLNEKIYHEILDDKFSILSETRKNAADLDVAITLSMAFARGCKDLNELDEMVNSLIELAQSRGGDQVAVKEYGKDVKYYGGNQEAVSKRSRVRVRVMAQAFKEALLESDQVFISGHRNMDFDCMGANLALSRIAQAYGKKAYIVSNSGGIESYTENAMNSYAMELGSRHKFISDEEACKLQKKNDLYIVVDYHNPQHSNSPLLMSQMERIIVIDHHRRTENYIKKPLLVYIESGASSSCELLTEFFPYLLNSVDINDIEALIMYLGILVDTNHFKMRTGFRTFEAAAVLKKLGADPIAAEDLLKENYEDFIAKNKIINNCEIYQGNLAIACVDTNEIMSRNIMSMGADTLLSIRNIEASFVVAKTNENEVGISCRSKGSINVQRIMEEMHGGGHFSAAAVQIKDKSVSEVKEALLQQIDLYLEEESEHESNLA